MATVQETEEILGNTDIGSYTCEPRSMATVGVIGQLPKLETLGKIELTQVRLLNFY